MQIKDYAKELIEHSPILKDVSEKKEVLWINERYIPFSEYEKCDNRIVTEEDIRDAEERLQRFAPFIRKCFPETEPRHGIIESPLREISAMKVALERIWEKEHALDAGKTEECGTGTGKKGTGESAKISGRLFLKMDSHLAVAGSVKARGGIYEVLKHAEDLAIEAGLLEMSDNYEKLASPEMKAFFGKYTVQVGSTGNLGLSIGICSAAIGFQVKVHMSADAKQWKKDLLRSKGVEVIEYADDYSRAVAEGRRLSDADPMSYFVDDEKSINLFLGYATAANRLEKQLTELGLSVDEEHPLIVYIPCGVGGAPGGITYGLKMLYKDNVHVFFVEPTLCPSVLLGFATGLNEKANVHDFGISGITEADGLACAGPSGFVTRIDANLVSGDFTVEDAKLYDFLRTLKASEDILIEPSSCAAFIGPCRLESTENGRTYLSNHGLSAERMKNATQIVWATGGRLVPDEVWEEYLEKRL